MNKFSYFFVSFFLLFSHFAFADCATGSLTPDCYHLDANITNPDIQSLFDLQISGYLILALIVGFAFGVALGKR